jgi:hypothetical protein
MSTPGTPGPRSSEEQESYFAYRMDVVSHACWTRSKSRRDFVNAPLLEMSSWLTLRSPTRSQKTYSKVALGSLRPWLGNAARPEGWRTYLGF